MKITELFEKAGRKVTCGCTEDSCSHCKGQHTLEEVGEKCSCCGNEIKEVSTTNENFLRNLVGDIRNAFKPGVAVTPNMVKELEAGLAAIQRGEQPTRRQQATLDNFMSDTLARELKKTFNIDISETTAGGVAAVAMPLGNMQSRNGTVTPKKKKKKKAEEGFASDAQRRAAFASGYDPKKKKRKS